MDVVAELQRELGNRSEARRTASHTAQVIVDSMSTFENRLIRVHQNLAEEMTKLRADVGVGGGGGGGGGAANGAGIGDVVRALLKTQERSIRQLFVGREESAIKQIEGLRMHVDRAGTTSRDDIVARVVRGIAERDEENEQKRKGDGSGKDSPAARAKVLDGVASDLRRLQQDQSARDGDIASKLGRLEQALEAMGDPTGAPSKVGTDGRAAVLGGDDDRDDDADKDQRQMKMRSKAGRSSKTKAGSSASNKGGKASSRTAGKDPAAKRPGAREAAASTESSSSAQAGVAKDADSFDEDEDKDKDDTDRGSKVMGVDDDGLQAGSGGGGGGGDDDDDGDDGEDDDDDGEDDENENDAAGERDGGQGQEDDVWVRVMDEDTGEPYFFHKVTKKVQWDPPVNHSQ